MPPLCLYWICSNPTLAWFKCMHNTLCVINDHECNKSLPYIFDLLIMKCNKTLPYIFGCESVCQQHHDM